MPKSVRLHAPQIIQVYEEQRSRQLQTAGAAASPPSTPTELQLTFGLAVREEVHCGSCGKTTHQAAYEQFFYTTQARERVGGGGTAGRHTLRRNGEAQDSVPAQAHMLNRAWGPAVT